MEEHFLIAVEKLRSRVEWMASNGAKARTLQDYNFILKSVIGYYNISKEWIKHSDVEELEYIARFNYLLENYNKLVLFIKLHGFTDSAIAALTAIHLRFLEAEFLYRSKDNNWLEPGVCDFEKLRLQYRASCMLTEADLNALAQYRLFSSLQKENPGKINFSGLLALIKNDHPLVADYMETGNGIPDYSELIQKHTLCSTLKK